MAFSLARTGLLLLGLAALPAWAGSGPGSQSRPAAARTREAFRYPDGVAVCAGVVYVVDTDAQAVLAITPAGTVRTVLGAGLRYPTGVAAAPDGTVYVADTGTHSIKQITPTGQVSTLTDNLAYPAALALGPGGTLYVADAGTAPD